MTGCRAELELADAAARDVAQTVFDMPVVLQAGAGTGKTAVLVARIIRWCVGQGWEQELDEETRGHVVADFKTDAIVDAAELQRRARCYAAQGAVYAAGVAQALGLVEVPRFELWFLWADQVVQVEPAAADHCLQP